MSGSRRVTAIAGIALAAMLVVAFALDFAIIATTGGPPQIFLASLSADLVRARDSAVWPIEAWLYVLQVVPFAIFILGVRAALRDAKQEAVADVATLAAVLFMALHTLHNLAILTVVNVLAPAYVPGAGDAMAIESVARGFLGLAYAAFLPGGGVGGLLFIAAMGGFAIAQRRSRVFPAWSGRLATTSAVLFAIAYAQYVIAPAFFISLVGFVTYIAWTTVVSVGLWQRTESRSTVLAARPV